jgi:hypothetical protein
MAIQIDWKARAHQMLTEFPNPPEQGWEAWVQSPTPVEFSQGMIDLASRTIWINPPEKDGKLAEKLAIFAVDPCPLLEKIPGMLTCAFPKPMGGGASWYRDHNQQLVETPDRAYEHTDQGRHYILQKTHINNKHFTVFLKL